MEKILLKSGPHLVAVYIKDIEEGGMDFCLHAFTVTDNHAISPKISNRLNILREKILKYCITDNVIINRSFPNFRISFIVFLEVRL